MKIIFLLIFSLSSAFGIDTPNKNGKTLRPHATSISANPEGVDTDNYTNPPRTFINFEMKINGIDKIAQDFRSGNDQSQSIRSYCTNLLNESLRDKSSASEALYYNENFSSTADLKVLQAILTDITTDANCTSNFECLDKVSQNNNLKELFKLHCHQEAHHDITRRGVDISASRVIDATASEVTYTDATDSLPDTEHTDHTNSGQLKCHNSDECFWQNTDSMQKQCNLFKCNIVGDKTFEANQDFQNIASNILLSDKDFNLKGDESFCNDCFEKAVTDPDRFHEKKEKAISDIKNIIAGRNASRELMNLSKVFETMSDLNAINPETENKIDYCLDELSSLNTNQCDEISDESYQLRLKNITKMIPGINNFSPNDIIQSLAKNNKRIGQNNCTREDYALYKNNQWETRDNDKSRDSFKYTLELLGESKTKEQLDTYCSNSSNGKSLTRFLSNLVAQRRIDNIMQSPEAINSILNVDESSKIVEELCLSSTDPVFKKITCPSENEDKINDFFTESLSETMIKTRILYAKKRENYIQSITDFSKNDLAHSFRSSTQNLRQTLLKQASFLQNLKSVYSDAFKNSFDIPTRYNSNLAESLGSKTSFCEKYDKSKQTNASLYETLMAPKKDISKSNKRLCLDAVSKIKSQLCNKDITYKNDYNEDQFQEAKKDLIKQKPEHEQFIINSVSCSEGGKRHTNPPIKPVMNNTPWLETSDTQRMIESPDLYKSSNYESFKNRFDYNAFRETPANIRNCNESWRATQRRTFNTNSARTVFKDYASITEAIEMTDKENRIAYDQNNAREVFKDYVTNNYKDYSSDTGIPFYGNKDFLNNFVKEYNQYPKYDANNTASFSQDQLNSNLAQVSDKSNSTEVTSNSTGSTLNNNTNASNLLGQINKVNINTPNSFNNTTSNTRSVASIQDNCNNECIEKVQSELNKRSLSSQEKSSLFRDNGLLKSIPSNDDLISTLTKTLNNTDTSKEIDQLRSAQDELLKRTKEIRTKVQSSTSINPTDISNSSFIYNARNNTQAQFIPRETLSAKEDQFSPTYSVQSNPVRTSFKSYREQRRESAKDFNESKKRINSEIDQEFLMLNTSQTVDDIYMKEYIDFVENKNGSIEHLVVFKDGKPFEIRLPDPKNQGQFITKRISKSLEEKILSQVRLNESESYTIYNMLSFGESLNEFISNVENEDSDIISLMNLNKSLNLD